MKLLFIYAGHPQKTLTSKFARSQRNRHFTIKGCVLSLSKCETSVAKATDTALEVRTLFKQEMGRKVDRKT